jgi:micrococcal nuclease
LSSTFGAGLLLAFPLIWAQVAAAQAPPPNAFLGYVTRVVDGDTIYAHVGDRVEKVRYIGLRIPEVDHPTTGKRSYRDEAHLANARLVDGRWVHLDVQQRDSLGQLLAYVWIGNRLINAELVWQGHAAATTLPPNVRYADYFMSLQRQAREARRGLWADPGFADQPQSPIAGHLRAPDPGTRLR